MSKITHDKVLKKVQALEKYLGKGGQAILADKLGIDSKSIRRIKQIPGSKGSRPGIKYYPKLDKLLKNKYLLSYDLEIKVKKRSIKTSRKYLKYHQSKPKNPYRKQKIKEWKQLKKAYNIDYKVSKVKRQFEVKDIKYYEAIKRKEPEKAKKIEKTKKQYDNILLELREQGVPRWFYDTEGYKQRILLVYNHFTPFDVDEYWAFWDYFVERAKTEKFLIYMGKTPATINNEQQALTFIQVSQEWIDSLSKMIENGIIVNILTAEYIGKRRKVSEAEKKKLTAADLRIQT